VAGVLEHLGDKNREFTKFNTSPAVFVRLVLKRGYHRADQLNKYFAPLTGLKAVGRALLQRSKDSTNYVEGQAKVE
jgi:hypothetical protein